MEIAMEIHGFNKTTLLDYPGHLAATIFVGGCNFRCPFCHNASLVLSPNKMNTISEEDIFTTLKKRKGILEGVCITGGEPTIYPGLKNFILKVKDMGYLVKLDSNGSNPEVLKDLVLNKLVDYVAMDVKNSLENYAISIGIDNFNTNRIKESIDFLLQSNINYEFRTTIVKEHHKLKDIISIGQLLQGGKAYYLQQFKDSGDLISSGLSAYSKEELQEFRNLLLPYIHNVSIRGVD